MPLSNEDIYFKQNPQRISFGTDYKRKFKSLYGSDPMVTEQGDIKPSKAPLYEDLKTHYTGVATGEKDKPYELAANRLSASLGAKTSAGASMLMQNIGVGRGQTGLYGSRLAQFQTEAAHAGAGAAAQLEQERMGRSEKAYEKLGQLEQADYNRWRTSYVDALNAKDWRTATSLWNQGSASGFVKGKTPLYQTFMGPTQRQLYDTEQKEKTIGDLETRLDTALKRGDSASATTIHQQLTSMKAPGYTGDAPDYQLLLDKNYAMTNPDMYLNSGNPSLIAKWYNLTGTKVVDKNTGELRDATTEDFTEDDPDEVLVSDYKTKYSNFLIAKGYTVDEQTGDIVDPSGVAVGNVNTLANEHVAYDNGLSARPPQLPGEDDDSYAKRMEAFGLTVEDIQTTTPEEPGEPSAPGVDEFGFTTEEKGQMQPFSDVRVKNNVAYVKKLDGSLIKMAEYEKNPDFANDQRFQNKNANDYVTLGNTTWVKQKTGVWQIGKPLTFDATVDDPWGKNAADILAAGRDTAPTLYDSVMGARVDEMFFNADFSKIAGKTESDTTYKAALTRANTFVDKSNEVWHGSARNTDYDFDTAVRNGDVINYNGKLYLVTSDMGRSHHNRKWTTRDYEFQTFTAFDVTDNKRVTFMATDAGITVS